MNHSQTGRTQRHCH